MNDGDLRDDQEMLDAIAAAFGDDAINLLDEDEVGDPESDSDHKLEEIVKEIDKSVSEGQRKDQSSTPRQPLASGLDDKYILVQVDDTVMAIRMSNVYEIQRVPSYTYLPAVPEWILGVANLRGNVVSVVDMRQLIGLAPSDPALASRRLVVTRSLVDELDTGLVVDSVQGIRRFDEASIAPPTAPVDEQLSQYLLGAIEYENQIVAVVDIEKLLLSEKFRQFEST